MGRAGPDRRDVKKTRSGRLSFATSPPDGYGTGAGVRRPPRHNGRRAPGGTLAGMGAWYWIGGGAGRGAGTGGLLTGIAGSTGTALLAAGALALAAGAGDGVPLDRRPPR